MIYKVYDNLYLWQKMRKQTVRMCLSCAQTVGTETAGVTKWCQRENLITVLVYIKFIIVKHEA